MALVSDLLITKGEAETSIALVVPPVPVRDIWAGPGGGFVKIIVHVVAVVQDAPKGGQYIVPLAGLFVSAGVPVTVT